MVSKVKPNKKDRRHDGRKSAKMLISVRDAITENLESVQYYDEWCTHRDGMRSLIDRSRIRPDFVGRWCEYYHIAEDNKKIKRKEKIRRFRKKVREGWADGIVEKT